MPTALVVDDSATDRLLAGRLLEKHTDLKPVFAANGLEALAAMQQALPDVVITDLRMPQMDGLALVENVRRLYPQVPVILMTAYGTEETVVEALHRGAASYVPKKSLATDLAEATQRVLAASGPHRRKQRLLAHLGRAEYHLELDNDPLLVPPLIQHLQEHLAPLGLSDQVGRIQVGIAVEEAVLNALYHGNLEVSSELRREGSRSYYELAERRRREAPYCDRRIHVTATLCASEGRFVIRDEGPGFDPQSLPDPIDPANIERASGRGLALIRTFMDEVIFNDVGNEITMVKRRREVPNG